MAFREDSRRGGLVIPVQSLHDGTGGRGSSSNLEGLCACSAEELCKMLNLPEGEGLSSKEMSQSIIDYFGSNRNRSVTEQVAQSILVMVCSLVQRKRTDLLGTVMTNAAVTATLPHENSKTTKRIKGMLHYIRARLGTQGLTKHYFSSDEEGTWSAHPHSQPVRWSRVEGGEESNDSDVEELHMNPVKGRHTSSSLDQQGKKPPRVPAVHQSPDAASSPPSKNTSNTVLCNLRVRLGPCPAGCCGSTLQGHISKISCDRCEQVADGKGSRRRNSRRNQAFSASPKDARRPQGPSIKGLSMFDAIMSQDDPKTSAGGASPHPTLVDRYETPEVMRGGAENTRSRPSLQEASHEEANTFERMLRFMKILKKRFPRGSSEVSRFTEVIQSLNNEMGLSATQLEAKGRRQLGKIFHGPENQDMLDQAMAFLHREDAGEEEDAEEEEEEEEKQEDDEEEEERVYDAGGGSDGKDDSDGDDRLDPCTSLNNDQAFDQDSNDVDKTKHDPDDDYGAGGRGVKKMSKMSAFGRPPKGAAGDNRRFQDWEKSNLIEGVNKIGHGRWKLILEQYKFAKGRSAVNLKDAYRNIEMQRWKKQHNALVGSEKSSEFEITPPEAKSGKSGKPKPEAAARARRTADAPRTRLAFEEEKRVNKDNGDTESEEEVDDEEKADEENEEEEEEEEDAMEEEKQAEEEEDEEEMTQVQRPKRARRSASHDEDEEHAKRLKMGRKGAEMETSKTRSGLRSGSGVETSARTLRSRK